MPWYTTIGACARQLMQASSAKYSFILVKPGNYSMAGCRQCRSSKLGPRRAIVRLSAAVDLFENNNGRRSSPTSDLRPQILPAGQMSLPLWARLTCIRPKRQGKVAGSALHAIRSYQLDTRIGKLQRYISIEDAGRFSPLTSIVAE